MLNTPSAFAAGEGSQTITLDGTLYGNGDFTNPLLDNNATLNIKILDPSKSCVLYEEEQTVNTITTNGWFNIQVGSVQGAGKRAGDDPNLKMADILQNIANIPATNTGCAGGYNPSAGDARYLRLTLIPSATGTPEVLTPDMTLSAIPNALVCESVQGLDKSKLLEMGTTASLTQVNIEALVGGGDVSSLHDHDSLYAKLSGTGSMTFGPQTTLGLGAFTTGQETTLTAGLNAADEGKTWYNSDTNTIMYWDGDSAEAIGSGGGGGIASINGDSTSAQTLAVGSSGTAPAWSTAAGTHTLNIPLANSAGVTAGLISKAQYDNFSGKLDGTAAAGGDLTGNYPNPSIANDAVTSAMILDGQVDTGDLADESVTLGKIDGTGAAALQGIRRNAGNTAWEYYTPTGDNLGNHTATTNLQMADNTLYGSSAASGDLTLDSTSDGTKGDILLNPSGGNVGIGTASPAVLLDINGPMRAIAPSAYSSPASGKGLEMRYRTDSGFDLGEIISFDRGTSAAKRLYLAGDSISFDTSGNGINPNNVDVTISSSGNVGIGTTTPGTKLDVAGTSKIQFNSTNQFASGLQLFLGHSPATGPAGLTGQDTEIYSSGTQNFNSIYGYYGLITHSSSGTASEVLGFYANAGNGPGGGLLSNAYGVKVANTNQSVNGVTNSYGVYVASPYGSQVASIANSYGLYVEDQTNNAPNPSFNIYSAGANAKNYFAGLVGIGTDNPGAKLEVAGQVKITGGTPGAGKVLTSDATGLATWEALPGGGDLLSTNNLSDVADKPTARTNLGLAIGTNVQAYDADLDDLADGTLSASKVENGGFFIDSAGTAGQVWTSDGIGNGVWTTPTDANTASTIVERDGSGNFSAGTITANLTGNVTGNVSGTAANVTGTVAIANGGTGQTSANAAFNALAPSQGSNGGKFLTTDGTNTSWATVAGDNLGNHTATTNLQLAGNTIYGSSAASGDLTIDSTSDATKGDILLNPSGGNVGIGATNPAAKLHVLGGATAFEGTSNDSSGPTFSFWKSRNYTVTQDNDELGFISFYGQDGSALARSAYIGGFQDGTVAAGSVPGRLSFFTTAAGDSDSTERMRITPSGNVGIGTASPSERLAIEGSGIQDLSIYSTDTGSAGTFKTFLKLFGQTSGSVKREQVQIGSSPGTTNTNAGELAISTSNTAGTMTERLRIDESGNVGIGTTTPRSPLDIRGASQTMTIEADNTATNANQLEFRGATNFNKTFHIGYNTTNSYASLQAQTVGSTFDPISLNPLGGNVGIGTTTPTAVLHLKAGTATAGTAPLKFTAGTNLTAVEDGTMEFDGTNYFLSAGGTRYTIPLAGGATTFTTVGSGTGSAAAPSLSFSGDTDTGFYNASSNDTISVAAGGTEIFSLSSAGLVSPTTGGGLVTTAAGSASAPTFSFAGDTDTGWFRPAADTLAASTGGSERVRIDSSGNVGIGTTSPQSLLHLGSGTHTGDAMARFASGNGSNIRDWSVGTVYGGADISGRNYDFVIRDESAGADRFLIDFITGNVGIGTTSPSSKLHVANTDPSVIWASYNRTAPALTAASSSNYVGSWGLVELASGFSFSGIQYGAVNRVNILASQTGTVGNVNGSINDVYHSSAVTLPLANGSSNGVVNSGSGVLTNARGGAFSVTNSGTGSITNSYGVYVGTIEGTNKWSLYANDSTAPSYIAGNVGIGTTSPGRTLDVRGTGAQVVQDATGVGVGQLLIAGASNSNKQLSIGFDTTNNFGQIQAIFQGTAYEPLLLNPAGGNVGIGTTNPDTALVINGAAHNAASIDNTSGSTIDFVTGNIQYTTDDCGAFDLHNLKDGGMYTFVVQGINSTTCSFNAYRDAGTTPLTVHLPSGHGATTVGQHTVYSILVAGTHAYFAWVTEFD